MKTFDLTGRSALVTGVGSADGIGFACARLLAQLGASVAITSRSPRAHERATELRASADVRVTSYDGDLTDEAWARSLVASVVDDHGGLHILVNNAGMVSVVDGDSGSGDIFTTTPPSWQAAFDRNVTTTYLLTRSAAPHVTAEPGGRIVNVASSTGPVAAMYGEVSYATGKAAVVGLTRALAVDLASRGTTVNAVAPGWIATSSSMPRELELGRGTPVGRCGTADEVASAIVWLTTPGAAYVTGQVVVVDGGNMIAEERIARSAD